MSKLRVAVIGAGQFGRHHLRVLSQSPRVELVAAVDIDAGRAEAAGSQYGCEALASIEPLAGRIDAAVLATPTTTHAEIGCRLLEMDVDLLVEKPIARDLDGARRLVDTAASRGRILQTGQLERFNPAVAALEKAVRLPLFFEIHRLSPFTPRSLDIDVVLDLMIHDLDIVLSLVGRPPEEVRAAGISVLTGKVDIANVRLAFPGGCIANLTASRISTERVRKLRLFQPSEYLSVDYSRQEAFSLSVTGSRQITSKQLEVAKDEPLRLELDSFLDCVERRARPRVSGEDGCRALGVALAVVGRIEEHSRVVAQSLASARTP